MLIWDKINRDSVVPGVKCDLGAPVVAPKCLSTSVALSSMVSRVFLIWLRYLTLVSVGRCFYFQNVINLSF